MKDILISLKQIVTSKIFMIDENELFQIEKELDQIITVLTKLPIENCNPDAIESSFCIKIEQQVDEFIAVFLPFYKRVKSKLTGDYLGMLVDKYNQMISLLDDECIVMKAYVPIILDED